MEKLTKSPTETEKFAEDFAKNLKPGDILALYGNLGAGKTTFIKGLAKGLGYQDQVSSPTFIFIRTYRIGKPGSKIVDLHHLDLYRAENNKDLRSIGIEEFIADKSAVTVIEWAEKIDNLLPRGTVKIHLKALDGDKRNIKVV